MQKQSMADPTTTQPAGSFAAFLEKHKKPVRGLPYVILPVKEFIVVKTCPAAWRAFDLYMMRDEQVVFYVGKSDLAFFRIWQHIHDGYKGRSTIGRFILCNWRASMNFTIELMDSHASRFADLDNDLNAIELSLIKLHSPCFNIAANPTPTPLPGQYIPTTSPIQNARRLGKVVREARAILKGEQRKGWLDDLAEE
jgi:hypothetical protein